MGWSMKFEEENESNDKMWFFFTWIDQQHGRADRRTNQLTIIRFGEKHFTGGIKGRCTVERQVIRMNLRSI